MKILPKDFIGFGLGIVLGFFPITCSYYAAASSSMGVALACGAYSFPMEFFAELLNMLGIKGSILHSFQISLITALFFGLLFLLIGPILRMRRS